jgi:chromate transporter
MQHEAVVVHGWVTQRQFGDPFAIARGSRTRRAVTLIGWQAAGWLGALLVPLAFFLPSSIVVYVAARFWNFADPPGTAPSRMDSFRLRRDLSSQAPSQALQSGRTDLLAWGIAFGVAACRLWRPNFHPLIAQPSSHPGE